ncbi:alanine racemase [Clavibacter sepedonicus]|uniref:Alanine racemase n=1 Tax=Clavibacter sepedonicus TaxID=31964 RepID=B0RD41_CLASE|nr:MULTISPECIES: alanine racemase [Clavibacter]MBD5383066.1 alanine racemase [Clavibacter sp.]OQJ49039.1 alanine racemase [Clavibacter sepedonicus]OQJ53655.1 alanine racemase [Clavibacter sepedonicus]UUK65144.1 alanine racemase [Clavibacter sepedonicus]CAQ00640.1 putative alanine racemase fusion protein [Clavibacter sepedonicus]
MTEPASAPASAGPVAPGRRAVIDLDAIRHNVRTLAALAAPARTMVAVKADAYGHGALQVARAALESGAESLAVLDVASAVELRRAGIDARLLAWLHGVDTDFRVAVEEEIDLGVSALWELKRIAAAGRATGIRARVHLKADTGLSRNGATPELWPDLVRAAVAADSAGELTLHALWSHLADASPEDDDAALARFREAVRVAEELGARPVEKHLAASSAGIRLPAARFDMVRFGIAVYGISPFDDRSGRDLGLIPAMTLEADVVSVKRVEAGHGVSYGLDHRTAGPSTLVLVPLGYADGIPRIAAPRASVLLNGRRFPVAGRIAMDQLVLDVGDLPVEVGDTAVILGPGDRGEPTAEEWAGWAETIGDEIVTRVGPRVDRVHLHERADADDPDGGGAAANGATAEVLSDELVPVATTDDMEELGRAVARELGAGDLVVLSGPLGAGKTTFTRGLGAGLGVRGPVTSPTFVLARTHPSLVDGPPLVHVDAYRLADARELDDLDIDFARSVVVVEWGEGKLDGVAEEWWELAIARPTGAGDADPDAADGGHDGAHDASDPDAAPEEPRTVRIRRLRARPRA